MGVLIRFWSASGYSSRDSDIFGRASAKTHTDFDEANVIERN